MSRLRTELGGGGASRARSDDEGVDHHAEEERRRPAPRIGRTGDGRSRDISSEGHRRLVMLLCGRAQAVDSAALRMCRAAAGAGPAGRARDGALKSHSADALRSWLAENPSGAGREKALLALDEAEWRGSAEPAAWRRYLEQHLEGAHRAEAQARISQADRDEALLLEDEPRLRAMDPAAADHLAYEKALALLDEGRLGQLARRPGPHAADAARNMAELRKDSRRAGELEQAARALFLPQPTLSELPEGARERAWRLREWALALDGARLHRMLAEVASPRAWVALAALAGAQSRLRGLPAAEARLRAERELLALQPLALDAPQLAAVAVLQRALGREEAAAHPEPAAAARAAPAPHAAALPPPATRATATALLPAPPARPPRAARRPPPAC